MAGAFSTKGLWAWECPCGDRSGRLYRTEGEAWAAYDAHKARCAEARSA